MNTKKREQANLFVSQLTHVEESHFKVLGVAVLWSVGMVFALGAVVTAVWLAAVTAIMFFPKLGTFKKTTASNPDSLAARLFAVFRSSVWVSAPFLIWQSSTGKHDILATSLLGVGFLLAINKYRTHPKTIFFVSVPYIAVIVWFLFESRTSPTFFLGVVGAFAYVATLGLFIYTSDKSRRAVVAYKLEQDEMRAALEYARDEADKANQAKSAFLANMSHELRTPLNGILGLSDVLIGEKMDKSQHMKLGLIRDSGKNLLALLNDILDLSKVESGSLTVEAIEVDMSERFKNHFAFWKPFSDEKKVKLVYQKQKNMPDFILVDILRLRQCLNNLISNALKFTPEGGQVTVTLTGKEVDGRYAATFSVRDTGIGISPEGIERLFKPFSQAEDSTARKYGGTGLGLTITKKLCRAMGGDIEVRSVTGQGSVFSMMLMVDVVHRAQVAEVKAVEAPAPRQNFKGLRCLAVEDNEINLEVLLLMLEPYELDVVIAKNGQEALDMLGVQSFDFILMDLQMPVLGGLEATKIIRASDTSYAKIPIIAMTANVMASDRKACFDVGMDGFIPKPLTRPALASEIAKVTQKNLLATDAGQRQAS